MEATIARRIDHAVLHPAKTDRQLDEACELARRLGVASLCVKPYGVPRAADRLSGSPVAVSTVIAFPHGGTATEAKVAETRWVCQAGAREVDMVVNIGKVIEQDWSYVAADIQAVVAAARQGGALTKVIFETGLLPDDALKIRLCQISEEAGAALVKTSTGFGYIPQADHSMRASGATEHDIVLMRTHCSQHVGIKASGGIRAYEQARRLVQLGATRLGTSATEQIVRQERQVHQHTEIAQEDW